MAERIGRPDLPNPGLYKVRGTRGTQSQDNKAGIYGIYFLYMAFRHVYLSGSDPIWFWSRGDRGGEDHGRTSRHAVPLVGCGKQEGGEAQSP